MYRPPVHSSIHQLNGPQRLAVAYFRRDVNYLGGCAEVGIALALGLVHSREAYSADALQVRTAGIALRAEARFAWANPHRSGAEHESRPPRCVRGKTAGVHGPGMPGTSVSVYSHAC
jgi:hypothetical protein